MGAHSSVFFPTTSLPLSLLHLQRRASKFEHGRAAARAEPAAPTLDKNTGGAAWPRAAGRERGRATALSQPRCRWASTRESDSVERAVLPPAERVGGRPRQAATPPLAEHAGGRPRHAAAGQARGQASTTSQHDELELLWPRKEEENAGGQAPPGAARQRDGQEPRRPVLCPLS